MRDFSDGSLDLGLPLIINSVFSFISLLFSTRFLDTFSLSSHRHSYISLLFRFRFIVS